MLVNIREIVAVEKRVHIIRYSSVCFVLVSKPCPVLATSIAISFLHDRFIHIG